MPSEFGGSFWSRIFSCIIFRRVPLEPDFPLPDFSGTWIENRCKYYLCLVTQFTSGFLRAINFKLTTKNLGPIYSSLINLHIAVSPMSKGRINLREASISWWSDFKNIRATLSRQTISSHAGSFQHFQAENLNLCEVYLQLLPKPSSKFHIKNRSKKNWQSNFEYSLFHVPASTSNYCWWKKSCTSWGWSFIPSFTGHYTFQVVVWDFFHQQYGNTTTSNIDSGFIYIYLIVFVTKTTIRYMKIKKPLSGI